MPAAFVSAADLAALSAEARSRPRRRANRNLHAMDEPVHRLLNAVEPGSYVRPHRHLTPPKSETLVAVAGEIGLVLFDEDGNVTEARRLSPAGFLAADLPAGTWHAIVSLAEGSVFFETKPGPYVAPGPSDLAAWAPAEGSAEGAALEKRLVALFT